MSTLRLESARLEVIAAGAPGNLEKRLGDLERSFREKSRLLGEYHVKRVVTKDPLDLAAIDGHIATLNLEIGELTEEIYETARQRNRERFLNAVRSLDYGPQKRSFNALLANKRAERIASCVVRGCRDRGVYWLSARFIEGIPSRPEPPKILRHDFASVMKHDPDSVLSNFSAQIDAFSKSKQLEMLVRKMSRMLESRSVVFIFDRADQLGRPGLDDVVRKVWGELSRALRDALPRGAETWVFGVFLCHADLEPPEEQGAASYLPPLADFSETILEAWIESGLPFPPIPPPLLAPDFAAAVMAKTRGNPEKVIEQLSEHFDCDWDVANADWWARL